MKCTPSERLSRIWALSREDPDCAVCFAEMREFEEEMARCTDTHPEARQLWAYLAAMHTYFHRCLEVISKEMRFPEEQVD